MPHREYNSQYKFRTRSSPISIIISICNSTLFIVFQLPAHFGNFYPPFDRENCLPHAARDYYSLAYAAVDAKHFIRTNQKLPEAKEHCLVTDPLHVMITETSANIAE
jgi:hypothetical protein